MELDQLCVSVFLCYLLERHKGSVHISDLFYSHFFKISDEYEKLYMELCCVFSLDSPHRGDSKEYTQYTIFNIKHEHRKRANIRP